MTKQERLKLLAELMAALTELQAITNKKMIPQAAQKLTAVLIKLGYATNAVDAPAKPLTMTTDVIEDDYSDNPNDENYRYADTGYIAGSHKERASSRIKDLAKEGLTVKTTDIDWEEIEADALIAEDVIKKANILGEIDYQALKDQGMKAGTAYLIQKVIASISPEPHWDMMHFIKNSISGRRLAGSNSTSLIAAVGYFDTISVADKKAVARKAYVNGINTLKSRLIENENIVSVRDLTQELSAIASEMGGHDVSALDESAYNKALDKVNEQKDIIETQSLEYENEYKKVEAQAIEDAEIRDSGIKFGFVEYVDGSFQISNRRDSYYARQSSMQKWIAAQHPNIEFNLRYAREVAPIVSNEDMNKYRECVKELELINTASKLAALSDPLSSLAWVSLGERFWNIAELSSAAFVKHGNLAIKGKYDDWDLTIKPDTASDDAGTTKKGKKKSTFELIVADNIERIGGDPVTINSTEDLKDAFGFRDIQSGTWVLKDKTSAKFHVANAAAAMMDLSDVVGIDPKSLAFGGRLALAIGARGSSGAMAHYEPVQRVINITKMKGGGSLGHEWFHAIDNILGEVLGADGATGSGKFLSKEPMIIMEKSSKLSIAFARLNEVMLIGNVKSPEIFTITQNDIDTATFNINERASNSLAKLIFESKDAVDALDIIDKRLGSSTRPKRRKNHTQWRKVAVAFHNQDKVGQDVILSTGSPTSQYYADAKKLDATRSKPYWSTTHEMAARAFQAFLEDSLKDQDRKNDYLSYGASNDLYSGGHKAYPSGDERKRINMAFKNLFEVIKHEKIFENTSANQAMMDAIFGTPSLFFDNEQLELNKLFAGEY